MWGGNKTVHPELFGSLFHTLLFNTFFIFHLGVSHWNLGVMSTRGEDLLRFQEAEPCPRSLESALSPALRAVCSPAPGCSGGRTGVFLAGYPQENAAQVPGPLPLEQRSSHNHREHRTSAKGPSCSMKHLHRRPPQHAPLIPKNT